MISCFFLDWLKFGKQLNESGNNDVFKIIEVRFVSQATF